MRFKSLIKLARSKFFLSLEICLLIPFLVAGQESSSVVYANDRLLSSGNWVQDKDFYFLTLLEKVPGIKGIIASDKYLEGCLESTLYSIKTDIEVCKGTSCMIEPLKWNKKKVIDSENRLIFILKKNQKAFRTLINEMRESGYFVEYDSVSDLSLIKLAWKDVVRNMNYIINAYTTNKGFLYPKIDSASFDVSSENFNFLIKQLLTLIAHTGNENKLFFEPSLSFSLYLLEVNYRDEPARFEPLDSTNKLPYSKISTIIWDKYPYSVILIPGEGPSNDKPISPLGKIRCMIGASQYFKGRAPFIVVSGGFVHPFQTVYCEAFQMKKYLIEKLNVPEYAIIMEPHARHTTTNIRNTNRILYRTRIPINKPILCTTTINQHEYILSQEFKKRCTDLMGYIPWKEMKEIDTFGLSFYPVKTSLQMDAADPLDP